MNSFPSAAAMTARSEGGRKEGCRAATGFEQKASQKHENNKDWKNRLWRVREGMLCENCSMRSSSASVVCVGSFLKLFLSP